MWYIQGSITPQVINHPPNHHPVSIGAMVASPSHGWSNRPPIPIDLLLLQSERRAATARERQPLASTSPTASHWNKIGIITRWLISIGKLWANYDIMGKYMFLLPLGIFMEEFSHIIRNHQPAWGAKEVPASTWLWAFEKLCSLVFVAFYSTS